MSLKQVLEDLDNVIQATRDRVDEFNLEIETANERVNELNQEVENAEQRIAELETKREELANLDDDTNEVVKKPKSKPKSAKIASSGSVKKGVRGAGPRYGNKTTLSDLCVSLVKKHKQLDYENLLDLILATGFKSKAKNFATIVYQTMGRLCRDSVLTKNDNGKFTAA